MRQFLPKTYYQAVDPPSAAPPAVVPPAQAAGAPGSADPTVNPPLGKDGKPFDPDRAQATIEKLRGENQKLSDAQKQREAAEAKVAEDRQREQGEYQKLADDYKGKFETADTSLKAISAERDKAFEIIGAEVKTRLEKLPEAVRAFVPDEKSATPLERLAKITELETMGAAFTPAAPGVGPVKGSVGSVAAPGTKPEAQQIRRLGIL